MEVVEIIEVKGGTKGQNKHDKRIISSYTGFMKRDQFRLIRYNLKKKGNSTEQRSGIEIRSKKGWACVSSCERKLEPLMWVNYWNMQAGMGAISSVEADLRSYVYIKDIIKLEKNYYKLSEIFNDIISDSNNE